MLTCIKHILNCLSWSKCLHFSYFYSCHTPTPVGFQIFGREFAIIENIFHCSVKPVQSQEYWFNIWVSQLGWVK